MRVTAVNAAKAHALADILDDLARAYQAAASAWWIEPFRRAFIQGERNPWCDRLRERIDEWTAFDAERATLLKRSVELPAGLTDSTDGLNAVARAAGGQKLWPVITLGKGTAKALVSGIRLDGAPLKDGGQEGWLHVAAVIANVAREREIKARWDAFAREIGAPMGHNAKAVVDFAGKVLRLCEDARGHADLLSATVTDAFTMQMLAHDPALCIGLAKQMRSAAASVRLATAEQDRRRVLQMFQGSDRTSALARQLLGEVVGKPSVGADKVAAVCGAY